MLWIRAVPTHDCVCGIGMIWTLKVIAPKLLMDGPIYFLSSSVVPEKYSYNFPFFSWKELKFCENGFLPWALIFPFIFLLTGNAFVFEEKPRVKSFVCSMWTQGNLYELKQKYCCFYVPGKANCIINFKWRQYSFRILFLGNLFSTLII